MPPDGPIWNPHSVSTIDLWTFIIATSSYGETVTVLAMGKDGFGVSTDQFQKLDRQLQSRGVTLALVIGHDGQSQRSSNASLLGWTRSNMKDKYYQEFDFATLVRYLRGLPNLQEQRYINLARELHDKKAKRLQLGIAQSAFASVNDRGRNSA